jgi:hypothetical protein
MKAFSSSQALGGHKSKAHPGQSDIYREKQLTRKLREPKREILKLAKEMLMSEHPMKTKPPRSMLEAFKAKATAILSEKQSSAPIGSA